MGKVTISFDSWKAGRIAPATVEIPVVDAELKKGTKP
jgi:hypothetical protein